MSYEPKPQQPVRGWDEYGDACQDHPTKPDIAALVAELRAESMHGGEAYRQKCVRSALVLCQAWEEATAKIDELEVTLDDEETAHRDTLRLWDEAKAKLVAAEQKVAELRELLKESQAVCLAWREFAGRKVAADVAARIDAALKV